MAKRKYTLRQARMLKELSRQEAADKAGVHYNTIKNWEIGVGRPDIEQVRKLCKIYGVKLEELKL